MAKRLFTEACIRDMRPGDELVLDANTVATPSALDLAFSRRIRVTYADGASTGKNDATNVAPLWRELLANDGTYVIEVRGGRPTAHRMTAGGPVLVADARGTR